MSNTTTNRLHFIDAIRAFAITMMLQGHFVHALLAQDYRDRSNIIYACWEYFRGITAPTFFTITGFVFVFLLLKKQDLGLKNPRVKKGITRAIKLICWGYLLRLSFYAVFTGTINPSFFMVDVLQCIGISLLLLIVIYALGHRLSLRFLQYIFLAIGILVFLFQPLYHNAELSYLPEPIANIFTGHYGSVFTIFPWFGYVCFGGFLAVIFKRFGQQTKFYSFITSLLFLCGFLLIFYSSDFLIILNDLTGFTVFKSVAYNNFLYMRLGDVFILFASFVLLKNIFRSDLISDIGSRTLSIYIIHFFILYGSWFGLGLTKFFSRDLTGTQAIFGAGLFIVTVCFIVLYYYKNEEKLLSYKNSVVQWLYDIIFEVKKLILNSSRVRTVQHRYQQIKSRF